MIHTKHLKRGLVCFKNSVYVDCYCHFVSLSTTFVNLSLLMGNQFLFLFTLSLFGLAAPEATVWADSYGISQLLVHR